MIRKYRPEDVDKVIEIWRKASEIAHPFLTDEFMQKEEQLIRYIYLDEADTWVYESEEAVAGFIAMVENDVGGLFIHPEYQRRGLGKDLLDFVKNDYEFLTVDVFKENPIGCAFYKKYGFKTTGEVLHEETGNMLYRMKYLSNTGMHPGEENAEAPRFKSYSSYLKETFSERVHKIPINAGFTCPNRDGSKGVGGCTYCNNVSFNPFYSQQNNDIIKQIEDGIKFYSKRYGVTKFLAYFQAYTNTYAKLGELKQMYEVALNCEGIIGIILGTRPDCINNEMLQYFSELSKEYYISVEYGIESSHDSTLEFINRCHSFEESVDAIKQTAERGLHTGAHIILGLPGETREMMIETIERISELPINSLKMHQLQIVKQTVMAKQFKEQPELFHNYSPNEYVDLVVDLLEMLNPSIVIERFISETPPDLIIHPNWKGLRTYDFLRMIEKRLEERNTYQGKLFQ